MCKNALTKINKTNPNLSFFLFFFSVEVLLKKKGGPSLGISSIKNVTLKLKSGYYKSTFVSSPSQKSHIFLLSLPQQALITTHT